MQADWSTEIWQAIAQLPDLLEESGLLSWLRGLDPLDKWITAIGAVLIGFYAIFHETLWAWLRRPKLQIHPELDITAMPLWYKATDEQGDSFQVRLPVINRGAHRAEFVEVYADKLEEKKNDKNGIFT